MSSIAAVAQPAAQPTGLPSVMPACAHGWRMYAACCGCAVDMAFGGLPRGQ
ncbi:MAG: hypothetical protein AB7E35_12100 [Diaphorobacter sp.]